MSLPLRRLATAAPPPPAHKPTPEQEEILEAACGTDDNLMINALAGTGKSTMLRMIERAVPTKPILYLAFNRAVVDEIEYKSRVSAEEAATRMTSTTTVRTFNGLGHRIWAQATGGRVTLSKTKVPDILRGIIDELPKPAKSAAWEVFWSVVAGVGMAKALGYVPEGKFPNARRLCTAGQLYAALEEDPDDLITDLIDVTLARSIQAAYAGTIDFNDQVYMPALFGGIYPKFPLVAVDEYQDLNPTNHAMLEKLVTKRLIGVGDPWQNIYGFRGAKAEGMREAKARYSMRGLNLSVSFRCPRAVVENARWRVPHYKWLKDGGHVETLAEHSGHDFPDDGVAIISRNNAPLFAVALRLLQLGRSVHIAGSDIGPKLVATMRRLGDPDLPRASVVAAIDGWLSERLAKSSTTAADLAACMRIFAEHGANLGQAIAYAERLFAQTGTIKLLTGHKAKGLEFPTVFFLDPWLIREDEQDLNLKYVIETRAQERLFYVDSLAIGWEA